MSASMPAFPNFQLMTGFLLPICKRMGVMTKLRTLLAALIIGQFVWGSSAHAAPGCSPISTSGTNGTFGTVTVTADATNCQWHYSNTGTNGVVSIGGGDSGTVNGSATAPAPTSATCAWPPCTGSSDGVRQDAGITNVLYNNLYSGVAVGATTSCRFIDNKNPSANTGDLFVPQKTLTEFSDFVAHAPGVVAGYCVQAKSFTPTATASHGTGFELLANGTPTPTLIENPPLASSPQTFSVPTTRVGSSSTQTVSPSFTYTRNDCIKDAEGASLCTPYTIVESQEIVYTTVANPSSNCQKASVINSTDCDGTWVASTLYSCKVGSNPAAPFTSTNASCLAYFSPPGISACAGGAQQDGSTWTVAATGTATSATTPAAPACTAPQTGTQTCTTNYTQGYLCNDGTTVTGATGQYGTTAPVINVASCTGCSAGIFSTGSGAIGYLYSLTPIPNNSIGYAAPVGAYAGKKETGSTALITPADILPNINFYADAIDTPLQNWTAGLPGYPNLTEWFGVCYDGTWTAPTTGNYTFVSTADDFVAIYVGGTLVSYNMDGHIHSTVTNFNAGVDLNPYNTNPVAAPAVHFAAGTYHVMVQFVQAFPVSLMAQVWVYPPGSTVPSSAAFNSGTVPPNSDFMIMAAPATGTGTCPQAP